MSKEKNFYEEGAEMSFLDHLDALRKHLIRSVIAIVLIALVAFANKALVFDGLIFAPKNVDFITYRAMCWLQNQISWISGICFKEIPFDLINTGMTVQFIRHVTVSFVLGLILAFPYVFFEIWRFIKPALQKKELKYARGIIFYVSFLFFTGVLFGYFILAPVSILFLGSYQVSAEVANHITIDSYISLLTMLTLAAGLIFEMPILAYFLAKVGLINAEMLKKYRKYAFVVNLVIAAIITPSDVASMLLMCLPLVLLYELSIVVVKRVEKRMKKREAEESLVSKE